MWNLLLVLAMTMILRLQEKFSMSALLLLFLAVAGILPLRFYIFYMVAMTLAASFVIAFSVSPKALLRNIIILLVLAAGMTYVGVIRNATTAFDRFGTLAQVQSSRLDLAQSGKSGFASDIDVSTPTGALSAVPLGLTYLMLAPFPWEVSSFRSAMTLPEVLVWWAMMPIMFAGIMWSIRNRLRKAFPILLFVLMLSLAYSIFQGNVGTAYRQRTQIQVFLFMFIAVGWTLRKEKEENRRVIMASRRRVLATRTSGQAESIGT